MAHIALKISDASKPIGVFGKFQSVKLCFDVALKNGCRLCAQDMAGDNAIDITEKVVFGCNHIEIEGNLLEEICGCTGHIQDVPGVVFTLK